MERSNKRDVKAENPFIESNEFKAFISATKSILKYADFEKSARSIFDACKGLIGATSGYVALLSDDGSENELVFLEAGGLPCAVNPELPMPIRGLRAEAYKTGKAVYHNDFMNSEWIKYMPKGHVILNNVMFAPLNFEGKTIGIMGLANKKEGFNENDTRLASAFAELASIALINSGLIEGLKHSQNQYKEAFERAELYKDIFAHDISNILQNLGLGIQVLELSLEKEMIDLSERDLETIIRMKDQILRGRNLIFNIQKLSESREYQHELRKVNLLVYLDKSMKYLNKAFVNKDLKISTNIQVSEAWINANELLQDVIDNILINAVNHNESEMITIEIILSKVDLEGKSYYQLEIMDNGIGISDELKERLFKSRIIKLNYTKGMGLGLILVAKIMESFKGSIDVRNRVENDYSKGTNFLLLFPEVN